VVLCCHRGGDLSAVHGESVGELEGGVAYLGSCPIPIPFIIAVGVVYHFRGLAALRFVFIVFVGPPSYLRLSLSRPGVLEFAIVVVVSWRFRVRIFVFAFVFAVGEGIWGC